MFYSGGTPELFACNKINRKEKDRRILNTNLTTNISVAHALGTTFCVYNSQFVYIHIGVSTVTLAAKDTLAILPSDIKVQAIPNIGVVSTTGNIASIAIENNIVYANPTFPQGNYFIDLVLKRA
mgnify:FL=1